MYAAAAVHDGFSRNTTRFAPLPFVQLIAADVAVKLVITILLALVVGGTIGILACCVVNDIALPYPVPEILVA